jgi:catechol 2,3-dioxygenase-like lactoylglutathione lyase family enzyme
MGTTKTGITGIRTVSVPVQDQSSALRFFTEVLGFELLRDVPTPNGGRWIELLPGGGDVIVTLEPATPDTTRGSIGIRFTTEDAAGTRDALAAAGVEVGELLRWPGTPPMFGFSDPDGNAFSVTELGVH